MREQCREVEMVVGERAHMALHRVAGEALRAALAVDQRHAKAEIDRLQIPVLIKVQPQHCRAFQLEFPALGAALVDGSIAEHRRAAAEGHVE